MRWFVRLIALIVIAALAGPFFLRGPDGRPLMTVGDLSAKVAAGAARAKTGLKHAWTRAGRAAGDEDAGKVEMYRWQDASGQWHYADEPPAQGGAERILIDPNASRMDPVSTGVAPATGDAAPRVLPDAVPGLPSPDTARRALDEARTARDALEAREAELRKKADPP